MKPIFKDDPQVIEKLTKKIEYLESVQKHMKEVNKNYKKYGMEWAIKNVSADTLRFYARDMSYSWNKNKIYPNYMLTNNNAVIRQTKIRLQQILKKQSSEVK